MYVLQRLSYRSKRVSVQENDELSKIQRAHRTIVENHIDIGMTSNSDEDGKIRLSYAQEYALNLGRRGTWGTRNKQNSLLIKLIQC